MLVLVVVGVLFISCCSSRLFLIIILLFVVRFLCIYRWLLFSFLVCMVWCMKWFFVFFMNIICLLLISSIVVLGSEILFLVGNVICVCMYWLVLNVCVWLFSLVCVCIMWCLLLMKLFMCCRVVCSGCLLVLVRFICMFVFKCFVWFLGIFSSNYKWFGLLIIVNGCLLLGLIVMFGFICCFISMLLMGVCSGRCWLMCRLLLYVLVKVVVCV